jgi:hypothetical protein
VGKRLAFITARTRRTGGMHKCGDSPERRQAAALVVKGRVDMARLAIDDGGQMVRRSTDAEVNAPIPMKRVISAGRRGDAETPGRIIEAVA